MRRPYSSSDTVRAAPIRIVRVVVVDVATGVDIPRIVGIATIARTQPHVDRGVQPTTCFFIKADSDIPVSVFILLMPPFNSRPQIPHH